MKQGTMKVFVLVAVIAVLFVGCSRTMLGADGSAAAVPARASVESVLQSNNRNNGHSGRGCSASSCAKSHYRNEECDYYNANCDEDYCLNNEHMYNESCDFYNSVGNNSGTNRNRVGHHNNNGHDGYVRNDQQGRALPETSESDNAYSHGHGGTHSNGGNMANERGSGHHFSNR